jgi:hypothetical protein
MQFGTHLFVKSDASLLLGPRIREGLGKTGDREGCGRRTLDDRGNDAGRHEGERGQKPDVPFSQGFT